MRNPNIRISALIRAVLWFRFLFLVDEIGLLNVLSGLFEDSESPLGHRATALLLFSSNCRTRQQGAGGHMAQVLLRHRCGIVAEQV